MFAIGLFVSMYLQTLMFVFKYALSLFVSQAIKELVRQFLLPVATVRHTWLPKRLSAISVHEVLVNRIGGLSLPRKSVVRLGDRPDMTLDVYRGWKTTTQQQPRHSFRDCCA